MASNQKFVDYVCDQLRSGPGVQAKKMFGEYALFCDSKMVALICDNQLFVKPTAGGRALLKNVTEAPPYKSAKNYFLIDEQLEDAELMAALFEATARELPIPKPKKKATSVRQSVRKSVRKPAKRSAKAPLQ
jgi:TfoX/Sxy family transcriptional regulator of competence genes